jgi:hypothetical protein
MDLGMGSNAISARIVGDSFWIGNKNKYGLVSRRDAEARRMRE